MDRPLPTVEASASLDDAFALLSGGAPALVAVRGDRPAGVVTKLDLLEYLAHRPVRLGKYGADVNRGARRQPFTTGGFVLRPLRRRGATGPCSWP